MSNSQPARPRGRGVRGLGVGIAAAALVAGAVVLPTTAQAAPVEPADTVFTNGKVMEFTADGSNVKFSEAIAVRDGIISHIGSEADALKQVGDSTKVYDLGGRLLMPGLGDGHMHGARKVDCDLDYEGGTLDTILGKIKACLESPEQAQYLNSNITLNVSNFMGEGMIPEDARLDRHVLDRLSAKVGEDAFGTGTTRPIAVSHMDSHKAYTNSKAIENAGITADTDPGGGFIGIGADGLPNGQFADFFGNWGDAAPRDPDGSYKLLAENIAYANSLGITQAMRPGGGRGDAERIVRLADEGKLTMHLSQALSASNVRGDADQASVAAKVESMNAVRSEFDGYASPKSPGELKIDTVKIFCDGVPEYPGQTAAMLKPYKKNVGTAENPVWVEGDNRGEEPSCEDSKPGFSALDASKWNIHIHSLGDRSTRVSLDNFAEVNAANPDWDRRHTITHLQFVDPAEIPRFEQLGVIASMSLQWAQRDAWSTHGIEGYVDPELLPRLYPARELLDNGAVIAAGSDWPVTNLMPWRQIQTAVTRTGPANPARAIYPGALAPDEAISLVEAVRAGTWGVAYQLHQEDVTGTLEVGKLADLIVTDQNIFEVDIDRVADTRVFLTMLKGTPVYEAQDSPLEAVTGCPEGKTCGDDGGSDADAAGADAAANGADTGGTAQASATAEGTANASAGSDSAGSAAGGSATAGSDSEGSGSDASKNREHMANTGGSIPAPVIVSGVIVVMTGLALLMLSVRRRRAGRSV